MHPIHKKYPGGSYHQTTIEAGDPYLEPSSDSDSQKNIVTGKAKEQSGINVVVDIHQQTSS